MKVLVCEAGDGKVVRFEGNTHNIDGNTALVEGNMCGAELNE
ncbi:hypothetical protein [Jeotgalibacillus sp. JSM ZJ347]